MIIVKAPMRVSFAGGGSDLPSYLIHQTFGKTLTTTINKSVYVTINKSSSESYRLVYSAIEECLTPDEISHSILRQLIKRHTPKEPLQRQRFRRSDGLEPQAPFVLPRLRH